MSSTAEHPPPPAGPPAYGGEPTPRAALDRTPPGTGPRGPVPGGAPRSTASGTVPVRPDTTTAGPHRPRPAAHPRRGTVLLLVAVFGGMLLALLDSMVVGTALPRIVGELGGASLYTWTVTAYLLAATATVPVYGRLSDVYGRKPLLIIGLVLFLSGSALAAGSGAMWWLIAARVVQGLGAGALTPLSLALAADLIPPERRGRMQGAFGALMGLSWVLGPALGGVLTDHADWRWIFLVNLPLGVLILAVVAVTLPHRPRDRNTRVRIDYAGIAVFTAAVGALLIGLSQKGDQAADGSLRAWTDPWVAAPLTAGAVLLAVFVFVERRVAEPLIPLGMFADRAYTTFNIASFFSAFPMFAGLLFLPRYFQGAHAIGATESGLRMYPLMIGMVAGSLAAGTLVSRTGRFKPWLLAGALSMTAGTLMFAGLDAGTPLAVSGVWMGLTGLGVGSMMAGLTVGVQSTVAPRHLGLATGKLSFFRQIGGSVALAVAGAVYAQSMNAAAPVDGIAAATAGSTGSVLLWIGSIGAVATLAALLLAPNRRLAKPS